MKKRSINEIIFPASLSFTIPDPTLAASTTSLLSDNDSDTTLEDEEHEKAMSPFLLEEGEEEEGDWLQLPSTAAKARRRRRLIQFITLLFPLLLLTTLILTYVLSRFFSKAGKHSYHGQGLLPISWEHIANGTFAVERKQLDWLAEAGDGVYSFRLEDGSIELVDVGANSSRVLVKGEDVQDSDGNTLLWNTFKVSADLKFILFSTDYIKQWRHSSYQNYYVHTISTRSTKPLRPTIFPSHTSIATFSPKDHHVAFVHANDLYVIDDAGTGGTVRITKTGSPTTFNGVPDWVYEEEVFESNSALWWSPTGTKLAFLSFDELLVPKYEFPIYNTNPWVAGEEGPYPKNIVMRYPKPGYPNPLVQIQVFDLEKYLALSIVDGSTEDQDTRVASSTYSLKFQTPFFSAQDTIISEVTWVDHNQLIIKATNRIGNVLKVGYFVIGDEEEEDGENVVWGMTVREVDWSVADGGWEEPGQNVLGISSTLLLRSKSLSSSIQDYPAGYLDIITNSKGFNHIAFFSPPDSGTPIFLTEGDWEVEGGIEGIDFERGVVYFIAANPSIERHLYSVNLPTVSGLKVLVQSGAVPEPTVLTNTTERGYFRTSFSPFGGFYVLNYEGPEVPWQRLVKVDDSKFVNVVTTNERLKDVDSQFMSAEITYTTIVVDGQELNVMELRPPLMDISGRTKYPVLFSVYGGPASQKVSTTYFRDWHSFLCTSLNYVVVMVDPRGTGYKGRDFRMPVRDRLGALEANDTVAAGRYYAGLPYIDEKRVGIWGWSYGGFLTSKVIETNSSVFTLGISVAPVTDWAYYDSIYTERYMSTPELNPEGYKSSAVTKMDGFKNVDFALAHGSGDDNVHFLNSAALLDRLTVASVRRFRFRMFTDSDHSMSMRNGYWELMPWLTAFLEEKWGDGGRTKMKWKLTAHDVEK